MRITPAILQHELIGLDVKVVRSSDPTYIGITGSVIEETRNTLVILHNRKKKTVVKTIAVFHFTMPEGSIVEIEGKTIVRRPENRINRQIKRRW